ncbi:hypothetical protein OEB99_09220 [Actinotalea sp. M2MS4P-6]|uniref:hypothetical protein n=1 Tax=Actinotalea sp. M2MS4P-6 TaxID=2983762 RepID=UPI0021E4D239|nr:hypothetical protein [Actinotalea sp. M2MS4P-6]MCV2394490.1 hypothetical protein [Actinotalea sp. M2MS4P-6]
MFAEAIHVGGPELLVERRRTAVTEDEAPAEAVFPSSGRPRGLSLISLRVTRNWDGLWGLLGRRDQIYFMTVAFDLSGRAPIVLPPEQVPDQAIYRVRRGETISFTLGDGSPVYPPHVLKGGLMVYLVVCDADQGTRHVGEVMAKVHADLTKGGSLTDTLMALIKNPTSTVVDEVLRAATAALLPIATILQSQGDEFVGVFSGIYPAKGPWKGKLAATQNGTEIELRELRG